MLKKWGQNLFSKLEYNSLAASDKNSAFTLAEVVIVMLIIAVVASVSIKIAKSKMDKITSYTYYNAYNTIAAAIREMNKDYDSSNEDDITGSCEDGVYLKDYGCIKTTNSFSPLNTCDGTSIWDPNFTSSVSEWCSSNDWAAAKKKCADLGLTLPDFTTLEKIWQDSVNSPNASFSGWYWSSTDYFNDDAYAIEFPGGFNRLVNKWATPQALCIDPDYDPDDEDLKVKSLPRKGERFCEQFAGYVNTTSHFIDGGEECKGDDTTNLTEFAGKKPDIVLRNGMSLYNLSATEKPVKIDVLAGNSKNNKYNRNDGVEVDLDEYGYIIYIDVDGINGDGVLWDDVYKFYVTLSGLVIPAFDADNPETAGGDSRFHLQTSVSNEVILNNKRQTNWITKSKSFKESACTMGYINAATPYCSGVTANAACTSNQEDCHLRIIMPIKFFGP